MMASIHAANIVPVPSPAIMGYDRAALSDVEQMGYLVRHARQGAAGPAAVQPALHSAEWVLRGAKSLDMYPLDHHAEIPGMSKFFLPEILWQVQRALYLDVDMLLAGDIQDLYGYFKEWRRTPSCCTT